MQKKKDGDVGKIKDDVHESSLITCDNALRFKRPFYGSSFQFRIGKFSLIRTPLFDDKKGRFSARSFKIIINATKMNFTGLFTASSPASALIWNLPVWKWRRHKERTPVCERIISEGIPRKRRRWAIFGLIYPGKGECERKLRFVVVVFVYLFINFSS